MGGLSWGEVRRRMGRKLGRKLIENWVEVGEIVWENVRRKLGMRSLSWGKGWRILGPFNQSTILLARIAVWFYTLLVIGIYLFLDEVLFKIGNISF